jgi:hypothetical protein
MSAEPSFYAVDRFEGDLAVIVDDSGDTLEVRRSLLPEDTEEGSVLRVWPDDGSGGPDWATAELADDEAEARLERARETLGELKKRDPGGDIVL